MLQVFINNSLITEKDIKENFDISVVQRGRQYALQGRVKQVQFHQDDYQFPISARVQGESLYSVRIGAYADGEVYIQGVCTCPYAENCKHAVAVLYYLNQHPEILASQNISQLPIEKKYSHWLHEIKQSLHEKKPQQPLEIIYLIDLIVSDNKLKLCVTPQAVIDKKIDDINIHKQNNLNEVDRDIIILLQFISKKTNDKQFILDHTLGEAVLNCLLKTGRIYWKEYTSAKKILSGQPKKITLQWQYGEEGTQHLNAKTEDDKPVYLLILDNAWYVDPFNYGIGQPILDLNVKTIQSLLEHSGKILPEDSEALNKALQAIDKNLPLLKTHKQKTVKVTKPQPILEILIEEFKEGRHHFKLAIGHVFFRYQDVEISNCDRRQSIYKIADDDLNVYDRDLALEKSHLRELEQLTILPLSALRVGAQRIEGFHFDERFVLADGSESEAVREFHISTIPKLQKLGWEIRRLPSFPDFKTIEANDDWYTEVNYSKDKNWFDVELGVIIDGKKTNLMTFLFNFLRKNKLSDIPDKATLVANLEDNKMLKFDYQRIKGILQLLESLYLSSSDSSTTHIGISKFHVNLLSDIHQSLQSQWLGDQEILDFSKKLRDFSEIKKVPVPTPLQATLRDYQQQGLNWLQFLREMNLGGILADDMGLGKTIQTIAHLLVEHQAQRLTKPCLIISPTSVISNWKNELTRFAPDLSVLYLHGMDRKKLFKQIPNFQIILTTYPLLSRDQKDLLTHEYYYVILDEAQTIKNSQAQMTKVVQHIKSMYRLCLSGTPLENHLGELWSLFNFLMPGVLGSQRQFQQTFRTPIEKHADESKRKMLANMIKPFILRRTKEMVAKELPLKTEIIHTIELQGKQRDFYETIRISMNQRVKEILQQQGIDRGRIMILDALLKLRQACCDPRLVKLAENESINASAKLEAAMELVKQLLEENSRILFFSQFTSMLSLVEIELKKEKIPYVILTGQTKNRQAVIDDFQQGKVSLFLISLKAGGTGLNLTNADTVIHYDPWWNPAVEKQATDRAHRIGQQKAVFVYKLVAKDTVEEKILALQKNKQALADEILNPQIGDLNIKATDFEWLFS
ncbi:MAG: DEAD/DEAH box helicase family protein [Legionellales bacterium]|nr:DEAD/DEAH box helicase family protein [Legionellales bacterium]